MLLEGGLTPDQTRRAVQGFTRFLRSDMAWVIGLPALNRFECESEAAIHRAGGTITYQVRVFSSNKDFHKDNRSCQPEFESLVEVLAHDEQEARLIASQMAACKPSDPMPLSAEVITDSTLTCFREDA